MNKIYRIVQYIQPWEIDDLERQVNQMIRSSYYIENPKDIVWDVTLNLEVVSWEESSLSKQYFNDKFNYLKTLVDYYYTAEFDTDTQIRGCVDKRRDACYKKHDYVIWLDPDVFFPVNALAYLVNATELISENTFIITPSTIKYWDNSWDCITDTRYLDFPTNHRDFFDMYSLDYIQNVDMSIKKNHVVKFGGGWFNLFTKNVFDKIEIPKELGSYGWEDLYVMICSSRLQIPQYVINGLVVSEIGNRYLENKDYLKKFLVSNIQDKTKISDEEFSDLVQKFYVRTSIIHKF